MLVSTDFAKPSGEGNPVFSKLGSLNRYLHKVFVERNFESQRDKPIDAREEEFQGINEYLPHILQTITEKTANGDIARFL